MSNAERLYSFPARRHQVLQRARNQTAVQEAHYRGELVAPTSGTYTLIAPEDPSGGPFTINAQPVVVTNEVATYPVTAIELPATSELSALWQERWALLMPDGTTRTVLREVAVALHPLHPVLTERDLTVGRYPNLVKQLGAHGKSLQPYMEEAWDDLIEDLWAVERWPELMLSTTAFHKPHRERTWFLVFNFLFSLVTGSPNRWETLREMHLANSKAAFSSMTSREDTDHDGRPDSRRRQGVKSVHHRNVPSFRRFRRDSRW